MQIGWFLESLPTEWRSGCAPGSQVLPTGQLTYIFPAISAAALLLYPWRRRRKLLPSLLVSCSLCRGHRLGKGNEDAHFQDQDLGRMLCVSLRTVPSWAHYPTSQTKDLRLRIYGLHRGPSQPVPGLKDLTPFFSITPLHPAQSRHRKKAEGKWPMKLGLRAEFWKRTL